MLPIENCATLIHGRWKLFGHWMSRANLNFTQTREWRPSYSQAPHSRSPRVTHRETICPPYGSSGMPESSICPRTLLLNMLRSKGTLPRDICREDIPNILNIQHVPHYNRASFRPCSFPVNRDRPHQPSPISWPCTSAQPQHPASHQRWNLK